LKRIILKGKSRRANMALIAKKDTTILLAAGFSEEDLGFVEGGIRGVEIYETPDDYFAHELIDNAKEEGKVDLYDDMLKREDNVIERYDDSRPGLYSDHEYDGNDDFYGDVPVNLREQVTFLKTIKLGKLSVWQRRNKNGELEWPVTNLKVTIPEHDRERYEKLTKENQKELWKSYARDVWKDLWKVTAGSLREFEIEDIVTFVSKKGYDIKLLIMAADNIRKMGFNCFPPEARWVSMLYFIKDKR
jgi:hypothetical protein